MWGPQQQVAKPIRSVAAPLFAFTLVGAAVHLGAAVPVKMSPQEDAIRQVTAAVSLAAAIDTSSNAVGIAESELYFMTPEEVAGALDTMQSMGVTQVRMFVPWRAVEPAPGAYNWADVDKVVDAAEERGIAVLGAVTSTPTWASDVQDSAYGAPRDPQDFGNFMGALASRYGAGAGDPETARISAYEIWNEPQSFVFWSPRPDPAAYTEILKAGYDAVKAVDPSGTVVGGVVTAGLSWGGVNINPVEFVEGMYAAGAAGHFDALSYHPYNYDWKFGDGAGNAISAVGQLEAMQALMAQYGDGEKDVWTSEYGLPTSYVSEAQQAEFIDDFMATWSEHDGTGPMFIYSLVDRNSASTDVEDTWGLFRDDYTPKQAAGTVQAWIEDNGPVPTDSFPPVGEIPDLDVPTVPGGEVPTSPTPVDPVAEAVANWQEALAEAAANWAAAWGQATTPAPATTTLAARTGAETEEATETNADAEVGEPATATDPTLESTDSSRAALIEATQAEPITGSEDTSEATSDAAESTATESDTTESGSTATGSAASESGSTPTSSDSESSDSPSESSSDSSSSESSGSDTSSSSSESDSGE